MRGEYIRRADAMEKITSSETQKALRAMTGEEAYVTVVGILNELPAADVRPVVRCKDCVHCGFCGKETNLEVMGFYGYYSRGKQKDGDG